METIGNRIARLIDALKLKQLGFAERLSLSPAHVSRLIAGQREVNDRLITAICREFNVDRHWLETGEGEMFAPDRSVTLDRISSRYSSSEAFRAMLDVYSQLEPAHQDVIEAYILQLADAIAAGRKPESVVPKSS